MACCLDAVGETADGRAALTPLLATCLDRGVPRFVWDAGPHISNVVSSVLAESVSGGTTGLQPKLSESSIRHLMSEPSLPGG